MSSTDRFSEKSLLSLGDYYVYGLIDPRTKQIFYIAQNNIKKLQLDLKTKENITNYKEKLEENKSNIQNKLEKEKEKTPITLANQEINITMTFGLTEYDFASDIDSSIKDADEKLYQGKESGRNKVVY